MALRSAGYTVREVQVYATGSIPDLAANIGAHIGDMAAEKDDRQADSPSPSLAAEKVWLAFFSPSSAEFALPHLVPLLGSSSSEVSARGSKHIRVFAIGETTARFLRGRGITVDAVAAEPSAVGLVQAIDCA